MTKGMFGQRAWLAIGAMAGLLGFAGAAGAMESAVDYGMCPLWADPQICIGYEFEPEPLDALPASDRPVRAKACVGGPGCYDRLRDALASGAGEITINPGTHFGGRITRSVTLKSAPGNFGRVAIISARGAESCLSIEGRGRQPIEVRISGIGFSAGEAGEPCIAASKANVTISRSEITVARDRTAIAIEDGQLTLADEFSAGADGGVRLAAHDDSGTGIYVGQYAKADIAYARLSNFSTGLKVDGALRVRQGTEFINNGIGLLANSAQPRDSVLAGPAELDVQNARFVENHIGVLASYDFTGDLDVTGSLIDGASKGSTGFKVEEGSTGIVRLVTSHVLRHREFGVDAAAPITLAGDVISGNEVGARFGGKTVNPNAKFASGYQIVGTTFSANRHRDFKIGGPLIGVFKLDNVTWRRVEGTGSAKFGACSFASGGHTRSAQGFGGLTSGCTRAK